MPSRSMPVKKEKDNELVLYRLGEVEKAVKEVGDKVDKQDSIKRQDLIDFRDTIVVRMNEIRDSLQKQVDEKADRSQVDDLRTLVKAVGTALTSIIAGLVVFYITRS